MRAVILVIALLSSAMPFRTYAQGGPPLLTDDPSTVSKGQWEINISGILASSANLDLLQFPHIDANYGYGDHTQLKLETGWVIERTREPAFKSGAGTLLAGIKQRFIDEENAGIAVSTYPQIQIHHAFSSKDPELNQPGNQYILPIELSKALGNWGVIFESGYFYSTESPSELFFGLATAYESLNHWEPLTELHLNTSLDGTGSTALFDVGFRRYLNPHLNLLFSIGHSFVHPEGDPTEAFAYFGAQLKL